MDSRYKLTTFKGMTVPQGYLDGVLSDFESADYLQKLGIPEYLYVEIAQKAVQVPRGFVAVSPNKNEFKPGRFVPTAKGESDWDSFMQNAPNRGWVINETQETDLEEEDFSESDYTVPEGFSGLAIRDAIGRNYTIPVLKVVADYYNSEIQKAYSEAGEDEARIKEIEDFEKEISDTLSSLVEEYLATKLMLDEAEGSSRFGEGTLDKVKEIVASFPNVGAYESTNRQGISKEGKPGAGFSLTAKVVVRDKGNIDRKDVHFGAFIGALKILSDSGNTKAQDYLDKFLEKSQASAGATVVLKIRDLFPPTVGTSEAYNLFYSILDKNAIKSDDKEAENAAAFQAAIRLAQHMLPPSEGSLEEQKKKIREQELFIKMEQNLVLARKSDTTSKEIKALTTQIEQLKVTKEMVDSIASGNFTVQMAIDFGLSAFGEPNYHTVKMLFSSMDKIFVFPGSSDTFEGILDTLVKYPAENIEEQLTNVREIIKERISSSGILLRGGKRQTEFTVKEQKRLFFELSSMVNRDVDSFITNTILTGSLPDSPSVRQLFADYHREENPQYGYIFTRDIAPKLSKKISQLMGLKRVDESIEQFVNSSKFRSGLTEFLLNEVNVNKDFAETIVSSIVERSGKFSDVLSSVFGKSASPSKLPEYAARAFSALLAYTIQAHASKFHDGMAMMSKAASFMTRVLSGSPEGFDSRIGSFFNQSDFLYAEFLNRLRVLPHSDEDGNLEWDKAMREFVLSKYISRNGVTDEIPNDIQLARFMSHMEENVPSHYLLTANTHNRAKEMVGLDGNLILNKEQHGRFVRSVQSSNLSDNKELSESIKSLESLDRITKDFSSGRIASADISRAILLSGDPVSMASDYSVMSLASALRDTSGLTMEQVGALRESYKSVVSERINKLSPEYGSSISEYVLSSFKLHDTRANISTIGHTLEAISGVPMLVHHMESTKARNISTSRISDIDGVSWESEDGSLCTFGGISYAQNGTIDYMMIRESNDGIEIYPGEGKMEARGGVIPHHGTPDNFVSLVANLWKSSGEKGVKIHPTVAINSPHSSSDASASYFSLSMNFAIEDIQSSGRSYSHGELNSPDSLRRAVVR